MGLRGIPKNLLLAVVAATLASLPAAAEEFYLKDGTKIVGKVVAYENNAYRVETSFGIAIIYRDRISRIVFPESSSETAPAEATKKPEPPPKAAEPARPAARAEKPPAPPPPAQIVEHVTGTQYVNDTYHFRMFKPPTWFSYPQLVKPQSPLVAALGTPDETTLLLIGRETYDGNLATYARLAEASLRQLYENYRRQGERPTIVAGMPAIERSFTGEAEGQYWTGVAFYFARDKQFFTLVGLTAESETTSFQEAVLRKVVDTFEFLPE